MCSLNRSTTFFPAEVWLYLFERNISLLGTLQVQVQTGHLRADWIMSNAMHPSHPVLLKMLPSP